MANTFKIVSKEAKRIYRLHPSWKWLDCMNIAWDNWRAGKLGGSTSKGKRKRIVRRTLNVVRKPRRHKRGKIGNAIVVVPREKQAPKTIGSLSGISAGTLKAELKRKINQAIDKEVIRKFHATGKRIKKKIQRSITAKKAELRKLC